jgi:hypothetical protein
VVATLPDNSSVGSSGSIAKKRKPLLSQLSTDNRDLHDNLALAAAATQTQTNTHRRMEKSIDMTSPDQEKAPPISVTAGETMMKSAELQLMTPLLNFMQLLCENHNIKLQVREGWRSTDGVEGGGWKRVRAGREVWR